MPVRRRDFLLPALVTASLVCAAPVLHAASPPRVLVLYATSRDSQIAIVGERELPRLLTAGVHGPVDYYSEFIDQARFAEVTYRAALSDFLRLKYRSVHFDVIVSLSDVSTEFVARYLDELFTDVPVVFFSEHASGVRPPHSTGIIDPLDLRSTLDLAQALQPDLQHLFVITGSAPADRGYEQRARTQLGGVDAPIRLEYLSGWKTPDLLRKVSSLPEHSAIYYVLVNRDGAGEHVQPLQYLERLAAAANAPTYSWVDSALERGIVGGSLKNQARQIAMLGQLAVRVLRGERVDDIPVSLPTLSIVQVDWRQLQRFDIPEARVPPGTIVRFKLPSLWERYAPHLVATGVLVLGQFLLIAGLLVQRARRRSAERQLVSREAALRSSRQRIQDLGGRLLHAQDAERSRIARELHDDVSQQLALLEMDLEILRASAPEGGLAEPLERTRQLARSVHDLSHRLHPARLRLVGLPSAIEGLLDELSRPDLPISFVHDRVPQPLDPDLTLCLFRVAQEALHNALKYSGARRITIEMRADEGLTLTVSDDGRGFVVGQAFGKGLGLVSMYERLEAFGGSLHIESSPGRGTRLMASVPLPVAAPAPAF